MADFLLRDQAPLTPEQFASVDQVVTDVARRTLVGRRFIPVFGPIGVGVQAVVDERLAGIEPAVISLLGDAEGDLVRAQQRKLVSLPIVYKDFQLHWRDIETSQQFGTPLDIGAAAAASALASRAEDNLIFNGNAELGFEGLLNASGHNSIAKGDWGQTGRAFDDVVGAVSKLTADGFVGPYALVLSPRLYASVHRVYENTGVLEIEQVRKLVTAGIFQTPVVPEMTAAVISTGAENMDIAIAQDLITAFLQTDNMNHYFRVLEILALRIKRPGAICIIA
jgi:uncharacterized linocin/CFP29 family protein